MWNAAHAGAPSMRSLLLAFAVTVTPLATSPGWGSEGPAAAAPAAAPPAAAAPATGTVVPAGGPTTTAPSAGEKPRQGSEPATGAGAPTGAGDKATAPPPRPLERLTFDCDTASASHTTCTAITAGSDAGCKSIKDEKLRANCVGDVSYFIAAKGAPADKSWRFPDSWMQRCGKGKDEPTANCEALRDAVRAGDASKCPTEPAGMNAGCRAMATADPSMCRDDKACRELVSRTAVIARGGLTALAAEATNPVDKSYARAALAEAEACKDLAAAMKGPCATARSAAAAESKSPPSTQPAPKKDKEP